MQNLSCTGLGISAEAAQTNSMLEEQPIEASRSEHRPLHLYAAGACYWITAATLHHHPYLRSEERKRNFVDELQASEERWKVSVIAWTLLDDHWHGIVRASDTRSLPNFLNRLHGSSSRFVNSRDGVSGRHVWHQYWDTFLNSEGDFLEPVELRLAQPGPPRLLPDAGSLALDQPPRADGKRQRR